MGFGISSDVLDELERGVEGEDGEGGGVDKDSGDWVGVDGRVGGGVDTAGVCTGD